MILYCVQFSVTNVILNPKKFDNSRISRDTAPFNLWLFAEDAWDIVQIQEVLLRNDFGKLYITQFFELDVFQSII